MRRSVVSAGSRPSPAAGGPPLHGSRARFDSRARRTTNPATIERESAAALPFRRVPVPAARAWRAHPEEGELSQSVLFPTRGLPTPVSGRRFGSASGELCTPPEGKQ